MRCTVSFINLDSVERYLGFDFRVITEKKMFRVISFPKVHLNDLTKKDTTICLHVVYETKVKTKHDFSFCLNDSWK